MPHSNTRYGNRARSVAKPQPKQTNIPPLPLIQEEQLSVNRKRMSMIKAGKLYQEQCGWILTDRPDMTLAVYRGR